MFFAPSQMLFGITLVLGTLISVSSQSWFGAWAGLEINLLSFIPLMVGKGILPSEAALKYFLTQAMASILLFLVVLLYLSLYKTLWFQLNNQTPVSILFSSALLIKLGAAPFHFWFPGVMEGLSWVNNIILMTWQKLAPLVLISYTLSIGAFSYFVIMACTVVGAVGGLNQTSLRKIMAYSSINHLGWMSAGVLLGDIYLLSYFLFYCFLSISILLLFHYFQLTQFKQLFMIQDPNSFNKVFLFCNFLSLGGLPPFLGFLPKWVIIQTMAAQGLLGLVVFMTAFTLVVLFYYLRVFLPFILLATSNPKWQLYKPYWLPLNAMLGAVSMLGLPLFPVLYIFM